jgi:hypothetical protein
MRGGPPGTRPADTPPLPAVATERWRADLRDGDHAMTETECGAAAVSARPFETAADRKARERATRAANARTASGRRRKVDPTTCDREYTEAEWEFLRAIEEYKRTSGRMYPTWGEVLEVAQALGYRKEG